MSAATLSRKLGLVDNYGLTGVGFLTALLAGITLLMAVLVTSIVLGSRAIGRTTCGHWASQTGFASKFVVLNFFDTGSCLGRWVKNTQIVQFIQAGKP